MPVAPPRSGGAAASMAHLGSRADALELLGHAAGGLREDTLPKALRAENARARARDRPREQYGSDAKASADAVSPPA